ncbi:MAG: carboxylating nicotinate-nucleotide diphosphorylase [Fibrobacterota bacterium]
MIDAITEKMIKDSLREDIGDGDITSSAVYSTEDFSRGRFILKEDCVISGLELLRRLYKIHDPGIKFTAKTRDGKAPGSGAAAAEVYGPSVSLLSAERTALNIFQHLCGIATKTRQTVEKLQGTGVKLLDTRKTLPMLRSAAKKAVLDGGGHNHRAGLYDMVLLKENHVLKAGGPGRAVRLARRKYGKKYRIEVEVKNLSEFRDALESAPDVIMLDNMRPSVIKKAVGLKMGQKIRIEVSGNINTSNIQKYALPGVDFISMGSLTHSAGGADISFLLF